MSNPNIKRLKRLTPKEEKNEAIRVLYVEDTEVIRDTIARLLKLNGYNVTFAKNGQEGVAKALTWHPQIVLMDLRMPVMDGYRAIEQLKNNPKTSHIPVIVVSAWSSKNERTQAKLAGADEFFVKPPDLNRLMSTIEKLVAESST
jgi:CheY-like chemotaxis protein